MILSDIVPSWQTKERVASKKEKIATKNLRYKAKQRTHNRKLYIKAELYYRISITFLTEEKSPDCNL